MSINMTINSHEDYRRINRQVWAWVFGLIIQSGREKKGYSIEDIAPLAGMEPSTWAAFEAGRVPETAAQLRSMAAALEFSDAQLATVIHLCRDAWEG